MDKKSCLVTYFVFIILVSSVSTFSAYGISSSPSTFFKGDRPYGIAYEDWMTKWWQWNMQILKEQHPVVLQSKLTKCPVGEAGSVSFLPKSTRRIEI
jgi:hypothetical protein